MSYGVEHARVHVVNLHARKPRKQRDKVQRARRLLEAQRAKRLALEQGLGEFGCFLRMCKSFNEPESHAEESAFTACASKRVEEFVVDGGREPALQAHERRSSKNNRGSG